MKKAIPTLEHLEQATLAFRKDGSMGILLVVENTKGSGGLRMPQLYYDITTGRLETSAANNFVSFVCVGDTCKAQPRGCRARWRNVTYVGFLGRMNDEPFVVQGNKGNIYRAADIRPIPLNPTGGNHA